MERIREKITEKDTLSSLLHQHQPENWNKMKCAYGKDLQKKPSFLANQKQDVDHEKTNRKEGLNLIKKVHEELCYNLIPLTLKN